MKLPGIKGIIDRRMLVNFTADPGVVQKILPPPFRPMTRIAHEWERMGRKKQNTQKLILP